MDSDVPMQKPETKKDSGECFQETPTCEDDFEELRQLSPTRKTNERTKKEKVPPSDGKPVPIFESGLQERADKACRSPRDMDLTEDKFNELPDLGVNDLSCGDNVATKPLETLEERDKRQSKHVLDLQEKLDEECRNHSELRVKYQKLTLDYDRLKGVEQPDLPMSSKAHMAKSGSQKELEQNCKSFIDTCKQLNYDPHGFIANEEQTKVVYSKDVGYRENMEYRNIQKNLKGKSVDVIKDITTGTELVRKTVMIGDLEKNELRCWIAMKFSACLPKLYHVKRVRDHAVEMVMEKLENANNVLLQKTNTRDYMQVMIIDFGCAIEYRRKDGNQETVSFREDLFSAMQLFCRLFHNSILQQEQRTNTKWKDIVKASEYMSKDDEDFLFGLLDDVQSVFTIKQLDVIRVKIREQKEQALCGDGERILKKLSETLFNEKRSRIEDVKEMPDDRSIDNDNYQLIEKLNIDQNK